MAMSGQTDTASSSAASGGLSDANIVALLDEANMADSASGAYAVKKATNPQVKAYAREMVKDHTAMMNQSHAMMTKMKASMDTTSGDAADLANNGRDKLKELTDKAAGKDWDKNYIESQVDTHQKVLDKLNDASKNSTDSTVTKALTKASAKVQEHLTKAQNLKSTVTDKS